MKRAPAVAGLLVTFALVACDTTTPPASKARLASAQRANDAVTTNAIMTIINGAVDGPGTCANGNPDDPENCNIYGAKEYVWLGGEKIHGGGGLPNGTYFFAVLRPGSQHNPNDGGDDVLSDITPTSNTGAGDKYTNRTFSIVDGAISYAGTHDFANNRIRMMGYDDTPNEGGEYDLAVCTLANGYPVDPRDCKYDNFKIRTAPPEAGALTAAKTAKGAYLRTFKWQIAKAVDHSSVKSPDGNATVNYTVTVTRDDGTNSNVRVNGTINVTNPNNAAVAISGVTDRLSNGTDCTVSAPATVDPGVTAIPYSCSLDALPTDAIGNRATITWAEQTLGDAAHSHLAAGSVDATVASIGFDETLVDESVKVTDTFGDLGTFEYSEHNSHAFTYSHTFTGDAAGTCTTHPNVASFTTNGSGATGSANADVTVCVGKNLAVSKTATPSFTRTYHWTVAKSADKTSTTSATGSSSFTYTVSVGNSYTDSDWKVTGSITVSNPNDWEAITADVADAINNGGSCTVDGGSSVSVAANSSVTLNYTCSYASAPTAAAYTNTATASWNAGDAATPSGSATGSASGDCNEPTTIVDGTAHVSDTFGDLGDVSFVDAPKSFRYSHEFSGDAAGTCTTHDNTATVSAGNQSAAASQSVKVCVGAALKVAKTAGASYTRTYSWNVAKAVNKTLVQQIGGVATFTYSVSAGMSGSADSKWQVAGAITVSNPNDWQSVTANVSDAIDDGGSCTVAGGGNVTVAANSSASVGYVCTYAAAPAPAAFTNTATATWDAGAAATLDASASGNASGAFGDPTTIVDGSATITDSFNGGGATTLGTLSYNGQTSGTYTYQHTMAVAASVCNRYDNTASYTATTTGATGSQSRSVTVCGNVAGGLTMGFWQNKNGQAIITGTNAGVCSTTAYLRSFAPFQDLAATATCAQVGSYATTIIKLANASGAAMNAMLKGQMLATALDVYYSSKIGAPVALGSVNVDLSAVSGAFGGATSMTVSQMLTYAASQSNAGGSNWYAQVKATQELAKNVFDDINNARALVAP